MAALKRKTLINIKIELPRKAIFNLLSLFLRLRVIVMAFFTVTKRLEKLESVFYVRRYHNRLNSRACIIYSRRFDHRIM